MKIKVCGMREEENLNQLLAMNPDYIGFIFYSKSKRHVPEIPNIRLPENICKVGVFVNAGLDYIWKRIKGYELDVIQLHGDETPEFCKEARDFLVKRNCNVQIVKAFAVDHQFDFDSTNPYERYCDFFLFDTKGKYYGGNSERFDWRLLQDYKGILPYFLSGGIGPDSVNDIQNFRKSPWAAYCVALDLNSRFEEAPGVKNIDKLIKFKEALQ